MATTADLTYLVKVQDAQLKKLVTDIRATNRLIAQTGTTSAAAGAEAAGGFRKIDASSTAAGASIVRTSKSASDAEKTVHRLGGRIQELGKIAVLASGIGGLYGLERTISAVAEATHNFEATQSSLEQQLASSGQQWAKYRGEIISTLDAQGNIASFSRNDLEQSFTQLDRTTGNVTDALKLNALAVNVARGAHLSLDQSAKLVSRVYSGNIGILKRYGIVLGVDVQTPLQALVALQQKFTGQGAAFGRTTSGEIQRLQNSVGLLAIDFSEGLVPALSAAFTQLNLFATDQKTEAKAHQLGVEFGHFLGGEIKSTIGFFQKNWPDIETGLQITYKTATVTARGIGDVKDALNAVDIPIGAGSLIEAFVAYKVYKGAQSAYGAFKDVYGSLKTLLVRLGLVEAAQVSEGAAAEASATTVVAANAEIIASNEAVAASAGEAAVAQGAIGAGAATGLLGRLGLGAGALEGGGLLAGVGVADLIPPIAGAALLTGGITYAANRFGGSSKQTQSLAELEAQLKQAEGTPAAGVGAAARAVEINKLKGEIAQLEEAKKKTDALTAANNKLAAAEKGTQFDSIGKGFHVPTAVDGLIAAAQARFGRIQGIVDKFPAGVEAKFLPELTKIGHSVGNMVTQQDVDAVKQRLDDLVSRAQATLARFQQGLSNAKSQFDSDWQTFAGKALQAFDAETTRLESKLSTLVRVNGEAFRIRDGGQTPAERELAALQQIQQLQQARSAVSDAKSQLAAAQATGDPTLIKQAEQALADARSQIRQAQLQKQATVERKAADKAIARMKLNFEAQRELEKEHFQAELDLLQKRIDSGKESQQQAQEDILNLFRRYHVSYLQAGDDLGKAFATGMHENLATVETDIGGVNRAFQRLVNFTGPLNKLSRAVSHFTDAVTGGGSGGGNGTGLAGQLDPHAQIGFTHSEESKGAQGLGNTPAEAQRAAKDMLLKLYGMGGAQWTALKELWQRESGWRVNARNASSGAYGIPQALPADKMASAGSDWRTNAITQIVWGLGYVNGRYGSPTKAWQHEQKFGWYESGGVAPGYGHRDTVPAMLTPGELILNEKHQRKLAGRLGIPAIGQGLFGAIQHFADGGIAGARHAPPPPPPPGSGDMHRLPELVRLLEALEAQVDRHGGHHLPGIIPLLVGLESRWAARGMQRRIPGILQSERHLYGLLTGRHQTSELGGPIRHLLDLITPPHHHGAGHHASASASETSPTIIARAKREAQRITRLHLPYVFGGGHETPAPPDGPFDCSSFVSRVLQVAGFNIPTSVSSWFLNWGQAGRGQLETLAKPGVGADGHVYMKIGDAYYGTSQSHRDGGPGLLNYGEQPGFRIRHPKGFQFGGEVPGFGIVDRIPALLTPGERVLTRSENQAFLRGGVGGMTIENLHLTIERPPRSEQEVDQLLELLQRKASRQALPKRGPRAGQRIGLA